VGGHCIAVDPWFIVDAVPEHSVLIRTAREVNDAKPHHVVRQAVEALADQPGATVAVLGLAFKANIDDVRESPSVTIVQELVRQLPESTILVVDPNVEELPTALAASGLSVLHGMEEAVAAADLVMLLVDHDEFLALDSVALEGKQVIDTKGIWNQQEPSEANRLHAPVGASVSG
jgi:UDP-N-acetyl-D-mannosaminuronic acid dehydrogenase